MRWWRRELDDFGKPLDTCPGRNNDFVPDHVDDGSPGYHDEHH